MKTTDLKDFFVEKVDGNNNDLQPQKNKINRGIILYIGFLPVLGLFLENYTDSFVSGVVLWSLIIVAMIVSTFADMKKLEQAGYDVTKLKKFFWIAPLYIFKRQRLVGNDEFLALGCGVFCIAAIFMNGFSQGLTITTDRVPVIVQNSYVSQLDNFSGASSNIIGETVEKYADLEPDWSCEKNSSGFELKASGDHDGKGFTITFQLDFDGYAYKVFNVSGINDDGKDLNDDDLKNMLSDIFISDSTDSSSDS